MAEAVAFMRGDAVIITGSVTGQPPQLADVVEAQTHGSLPVLLGSGVGMENLESFYAADGFIIGSYFKVDGYWANTVDPHRVEQLMTRLVQLRQ